MTTLETKYRDSTAAMVDAIVEHWQCPHVVVAPLYQMEPPEALWYIEVMAGEANGEPILHKLAMPAESDDEHRQQARPALLAQLRRRQPIVVYDCEGLLQWIQHCKKLWPNNRHIDEWHKDLTTVAGLQ